MPEECCFFTLKMTRLRFEVFSLERLWTLDKVFVLPPLEIRFSVAVEWRRVILIKSYPPTMSRTVKKVCGGEWVVVETC